MDLLGISCACPFIYNCCFGFSVRFVMFRVFRGSPLIQIVSPLAVSSRLPIHSQCFVCFAFFQHETSRSTKQGVIAGLTAGTAGALVGLIVGLVGHRRVIGFIGGLVVLALITVPFQQTDHSFISTILVTVIVLPVGPSLMSMLVAGVANLLRRLGP